MLALGLILVIVATLALVAALTGGSNDAATFDLGLFNVETTTLGVFLIGAATVLIFVMGLELTRSGLRSANRRRKEKKEYKSLAKRYNNEGDAQDDTTQQGDANRTGDTPDPR